MFEQSEARESGRERHAAGGAAPTPASPRPGGKSFLERVASETERRRASASVAGEAPPSHEASECTFRPRITPDASARRGRSFEEMSLGESERRRLAQVAKRAEASDSALDGTRRPPRTHAWRFGLADLSRAHGIF